MANKRLIVVHVQVDVYDKEGTKETIEESIRIVPRKNQDLRTYAATVQEAIGECSDIVGMRANDYLDH